MTQTTDEEGIIDKGSHPTEAIEGESLIMEDDGEENSLLSLNKLREKNLVCEQEKKEYLDGWQRMRADFANVRKEEETRRRELIQFASESLVMELLPVLDSFSMAFANKEAWNKVDSNWRIGVEYIYTQMNTILEGRGLSEIGVVGEKIDPRLHITMEEIPARADTDVDTVATVVQKGYRLHNKVVRLANIKAYIKN